MKNKTVYFLKTRLDDNSAWSEPDAFPTSKARDREASFARILGGIRTHSYEEKMPSDAAESLTTTN